MVQPLVEWVQVQRSIHQHISHPRTHKSFTNEGQRTVSVQSSHSHFRTRKIQLQSTKSSRTPSFTQVLSPSVNRTLIQYWMTTTHRSQPISVLPLLVAMQFADKWCTITLFKGYASYVISLLSPLQTKGESTAKERYRNHNIRWIRMVSELNGRVHKTKEHGSKPIKVKFWNWHTSASRRQYRVIKYGIPR